MVFLLFLCHAASGQMFSAGLSPTLVEALRELSAHIPRSSVQDRLLDSISVVLLGAVPARPQLPTEALASGRRGTLAPATSSLPATPVLPQSHIYRAPAIRSLLGLNIPGLSDSTKLTSPDPQHADSALVTLALKTLASFNFENRNMLPYARAVVLPFLESDVAAIRQQAAITVSQLLLRPIPAESAPYGVMNGGLAPRNSNFTAMIYEILERLLTVAVTDLDAGIRRSVLEALDSRFDAYLAQAENLHSLFVALNDEVFAIREVAITTIGRLALRNPAYVMPSLRKTLIQLLTELQYGGDVRNREESSKLIGHLIDAAQRLIKPYVLPILKVLIPRLVDSDVNVASCVLSTVGKLAAIGGQDMDGYLDVLLPHIIQTLQSRNEYGRIV